MANKAELIALAVTFGIVTEGLTVAQLQEALDANPGYQRCLKAEGELKQAEEAKAELAAKVTELEGDLSAANATVANLTQLLDEAGSLIKTHEETINDLSTRAAANINVTATAAGLEQGDAYVVYNGKKYGFTKSAPAKLSIEGRVLTQEEILNDEDVMTDLIIGGSAFVKPIV